MPSRPLTVIPTSQLGTAQTLIFDEVDAGVGGAVAETVGRLMKVHPQCACVSISRQALLDGGWQLIQMQFVVLLVGTTNSRA